MTSKTEIPGLYKVGEGILLNTDNDALKAYKSRKNREKKINTIEEELHNLRNMMQELKTLIKEFRN